MPILPFFIGLRIGDLRGLLIFVGTNCGGAGKFWISTEEVDSVDLRFLERVGAIFGDVCIFGEVGYKLVVFGAITNQLRVRYGVVAKSIVFCSS